MVCQVTQQIEARAIGPLEIVDDNNKRMGRVNGFQKRADSFVESELRLLRK